MKKLNERYVRLADKVSWGMGTPTNIFIWLALTVAWIACGPIIAKSHFLPIWFTSNSWNFPLNTITTLAELYIGFLVAAAANRSERTMSGLMTRIYELEGNVSEELGRNTELTKEVKELVEMQKELLLKLNK